MNSTPISDAQVRRRARITLAVLIPIAGLVLLVQIVTTVHCPDRALLTFDSAQYAAAGRHLSRTGQLATPFLYPHPLPAQLAPPFPLIAGHPLVPVLNAVAFRIGGARPELTLIPAGLAFVALVGLAGVFALGLTGSVGAALCVGIAVALSRHTLYFASEGLSEMPFMALFLAAALLLWRMPQWPRPLALGLVLGAAHFTRPLVAPLMPVWLIAVYLLAAPGRRGRDVLRVLLGFLPWAALLLLIKLATGDPFLDVGPSRFLVHLSPEFEPAYVQRLVDPPSLWEQLREHPEALVHKVLRFGPGLLKSALFAAGEAVAVLLLLYLVAPRSRSGERVFRAFLAATVLLLVAMITLTVPSARYLTALVPLWLVLGLSQLYRVTRRLEFPEWRGVALCGTLVALLLVGPAAGQWADGWRGTRDRGEFTESEWREFGDRLAPHLRRNAVIASDVAPWIAWYTGSAAVLLPATPAQAVLLDERLPLDALVLTNEWLLRQPGSEPWAAVYENGENTGRWVRTDSVTAGSIRAVVFRRLTDTRSKDVPDP